uniref:Uncharacterized protein n=1 Tax=Arundo donax TaxID=35708 RepID=A0A0A9CSD9_ARUDO
MFLRRSHLMSSNYLVLLASMAPPFNCIYLFEGEEQTLITPSSLSSFTSATFIAQAPRALRPLRFVPHHRVASTRCRASLLHRRLQQPLYDHTLLHYRISRLLPYSMPCTRTALPPLRLGPRCTAVLLHAWSLLPCSSTASPLFGFSRVSFPVWLCSPMV